MVRESALLRLSVPLVGSENNLEGVSVEQHMLPADLLAVKSGGQSPHPPAATGFSQVFVNRRGSSGNSGARFKRDRLVVGVLASPWVDPN